MPVSTAVPAADPIQVLQTETEMGDTTQLAKESGAMVRY